MNYKQPAIPISSELSILNPLSGRNRLAYTPDFIGVEFLGREIVRIVPVDHRPRYIAVSDPEFRCVPSSLASGAREKKREGEEEGNFRGFERSYQEQGTVVIIRDRRSAARTVTRAFHAA